MVSWPVIFIGDEESGRSGSIELSMAGVGFCVVDDGDDLLQDENSINVNTIERRWADDFMAHFSTKLIVFFAKTLFFSFFFLICGVHHEESRTLLGSTAFV